MVSSAATNTTHTFTKTTDLISEVAEARIYAGFHYRFSVDEGATLGSRLVRQLTKNYFRSMRKHEDDDDSHGRRDGDDDDRD